MNRLLQATALASALLAGSALAKTPPPAQTHQCLKDGQVLQKTKKECHTAGGAWTKMAAATKPAEAKPVAPAPKAAEPKAVEPAPEPKAAEPAPAK